MPNDCFSLCGSACEATEAVAQSGAAGLWFVTVLLPVLQVDSGGVCVAAAVCVGGYVQFDKRDLQMFRQRQALGVDLRTTDDPEGVLLQRVRGVQRVCQAVYARCAVCLPVGLAGQYQVGSAGQRFEARWQRVPGFAPHQYGVSACAGSEVCEVFGQMPGHVAVFADNATVCLRPYHAQADAVLSNQLPLRCIWLLRCVWLCCLLLCHGCRCRVVLQLEAAATLLLLLLYVYRYIATGALMAG